MSVMLRQHRTGEVRLQDPYCSRCRGLAGALTWGPVKVSATLDFNGSMGPVKPVVHADPCEEVLTHMEFGDEWQVDVVAQCSDCTHAWETMVYSVLSDPEEDPDLVEVVGPKHGSC